MNRALNSHSTNVQTGHPRSQYMRTYMCIHVRQDVIRAYSRLPVRHYDSDMATMMVIRAYGRLFITPSVCFNGQTALRVDQYGARIDWRTHVQTVFTDRRPMPSASALD